MKPYLSVIILAVCLISCDSHQQYRDTLSQVESYIEERPDSALAMECFVSALSEGKESDDKLTKARILFTQGGIYNKVFEWDKCRVQYIG